MSLSTSSDVDAEKIYKQTLLPIWRDLDDRLYEAPYGASDLNPPDSQGIFSFFSLNALPDTGAPGHENRVLIDTTRAHIEVGRSNSAVLRPRCPARGRP